MSEAEFMKKMNNTETELKERVTYKKTCASVYIMTTPFLYTAQPVDKLKWEAVWQI